MLRIIFLSLISLMTSQEAFAGSSVICKVMERDRVAGVDNVIRELKFSKASAEYSLEFKIAEVRDIIFRVTYFKPYRSGERVQWLSLQADYKGVSFMGSSSDRRSQTSDTLIVQLPDQSIYTGTCEVR